MTDPINTYSRPLGAGVNGNRAVQRQEGSKTGIEAPKAPTPDAAPTVRPQDERLDLSETARRSMSDPSFDRAKVDAIKAALREGSYPLDSRKMAESFVALERLIDD
ncbi:MAG: flagellar biosynthesis anti-sigma factor FlgM [Burkholderiaceae bacterium]